MTQEAKRTLIDDKVREKLRLLTELLPRLQDAMARAEQACAEARPILHQASSCLQYFAEAGLMSVWPSDLYLVNENGNRRIVTGNTAEQIRRSWSGDFLLDLPRQTLHIKRAKKGQKLRLGGERLHWGVEQVLIVGMSQPGVPFGYHTFSRRDPKGSGIGSVKTLTRYVRKARQAIGDIAYETRYVHKVRVDPNESPSRWGYVFDDRWDYLVIATCPPDIANKSRKSIVQSRDDGSSVYSLYP